MVLLYAATLFVSAALLFFVQPMFARMVLPLLGGSPAVWTTAMVFYQAALLAGYAYAHGSWTRLGARRQAILHFLLLLLPIAMLPVAIPHGWTPPTQSSPILWMLELMAVGVGLPFFVISTTSPTLQSWFSSTGHRQARDPYFLYVASNIGSLIALVAYPILIEPHFSLDEQSRHWMHGYWILAFLVTVCAFRIGWGARSPAVRVPVSSSATSAEPPSLERRARWIFLSFIPSSLVLGVTTYLSSEIAVMPLLWVIPLAIYLLTFIIAFAQHPIVSHPTLIRALPIAIVPLVMAFGLQATQPIGPLIVLHLIAFFVTATLCHTELAADRPPPAHLTEFYLWMAVGGVLGGIFNALIAPIAFTSIAEYPIALVLACCVTIKSGSRFKHSDWVWPSVLGLLTAAALILMRRMAATEDPRLAGLILGSAVILSYLASKRPLRFALSVAALLLAGRFYQAGSGRIIHAARSFFGVHRVTFDSTQAYHVLMHGVTIHGMQSLDPARRWEPLTYYYPTGPVAQVLFAYGRDVNERIGAVGLGAGSLAGYARPKQPWTYFEIDPVVLSLASDPRYFTFLRDSPGTVRVVLGDARHSLVAESDGAYSILILDAYSSDAIPVHLVTREALALYLRKLVPHGILAFHISNLHLDLEPVFGNLARDAHLAAFTRNDTVVSSQEHALGKSPSIWLVMARDPSDLAKLLGDSRWQPSRRLDSQRVWTDDYSSVFSVFHWN